MIIVSLYLRKTGNKSDNIKMNKNEEIESLLGMVLLIELFANVQCFSF